jgi:hypothetical protein
VAGGAGRVPREGRGDGAGQKRHRPSGEEALDGVISPLTDLGNQGGGDYRHKGMHVSIRYKGFQSMWAAYDHGASIIYSRGLFVSRYRRSFASAFHRLAS